MSMQETVVQRLWSINESVLPSSADAGRMELIAATQSQQRERAWRGHFICRKQVKGLRCFSATAVGFSALLLPITKWLFWVLEKEKGEEKTQTLHIVGFYMKLPNPHVYLNKNVGFWCCGFTIAVWPQCAPTLLSQIWWKIKTCCTAAEREKTGVFRLKLLRVMYKNDQISQVQIRKHRWFFFP